jgi:hypothetical protein
MCPSFGLGPVDPAVAERLVVPAEKVAEVP